MREFACLGLALLMLAVQPAAGADAVGGTNEPAAVKIPLRAGASLESVLTALNARGFRIVYSSALVQSGMTLRETPKHTRIDALLAEILAPWNLRAVHAANGDWLIVAASPATAPATPATPATTLQVPVEETVESIDVTASRFGIASVGASATFLDRKDVERMPHLADDAVRMLKVLPGVSGGDFSAALNIRGGRRDEALLLIDGAEIHNGFHFRDLDGALSVLDTNLVEGIDFITGGMTSEYGDYMSGVVDLRTRRPSEADEYRSAAGISFVSAYGRTGGVFADGRGSWLASARRGYLDVLMERVQDDDERMTPRYTDIFAAVQYDLSDRTSVAVRTLLGNDDLKLLVTDEDAIDSAGKGEAAHLWVTLDHSFSDVLQSTTVLAIADVTQNRDAQGEDDHRTGDVVADYDFRFLDLRSDWSLQVGDQHLPRWGISVNRTEASYDYVLTGGIFNDLAPGGMVDVSHAHDLDVSGSKLGVYASWRTRFSDLFTAEAGGRWDSYRYPQGLSFEVFSPRVNLVHKIGDHSDVRAAWSVVHQPQGIHELQIEDNVTTFFEPERSQHFVVGYSRRFDHGLSARIDVYHKEYSHLRPRFENALDPLQLIPEGSVDRIRIDAPEAEAQGVELTLRREAERGLAGWASLSLAKAREHETNVGWVSRSWEQRTTVSFGSSWTGAKWTISGAGLFHSGAPKTELGFGTVDLPDGSQLPTATAEERNGGRFGKYMRVDMRASRDVLLTNSKLALYFEVTNLFNASNPCCIEDYELRPDPEDRTSLYTEESYWLPMLPSVGFQWEF